jgi:hypothetical protein
VAKANGCKREKKRKNERSKGEKIIERAIALHEERSVKGVCFSSVFILCILMDWF